MEKSREKLDILMALYKDLGMSVSWTMVSQMLQKLVYDKVQEDLKMRFGSSTESATRAFKASQQPAIDEMEKEMQEMAAKQEAAQKEMQEQLARAAQVTLQAEEALDVQEVPKPQEASDGDHSPKRRGRKGKAALTLAN